MYQCCLVQVLIHIVAKLHDLEQLIYMLNAEWQFGTSNLLTKFGKMKEPNIAPLEEGRILA